jgi:hypothetical protein
MRNLQRDKLKCTIGGIIFCEIQTNIVFSHFYYIHNKMRNVLIFNVLTVFLLNSCLWYFDNKGIYGSGTVTKERFKVSLFDKIDVSGAFTVYLSQGDIESVDDNLQQYVEVRNEGNNIITNNSSGVGKIKKEK